MAKILAACLCLILGFCEQSTEPAKQKLGTEFELKYGESVQIEGMDDLQITFKDLLEDSRCPEGMMCVWEGNAKILLHIADADSAVNTTLEPKAVTYHGPSRTPYAIKLLAVSPYPKAGVQVKKEQYVVRLIVSPMQD